MNLLRSILLVSALTLGGCAGAPLIMNSPSQELPAPQPDKAQIVFLNPAGSIAGAFLAGIYEIKKDQREFYGMVGSKNKLFINVDPGQHLFMSNSIGVAHFLDANVDAGKRYYVLLRFVYGRGLQLRPIRPVGNDEFSASNPQFESWKKDASFVVKTPEADAWYAKYKQDFVDKGQEKGWAEWQAKTPEQRAELTLNRNDSFNH